MIRRSFLKTVAALGVALVAPAARACGWWKGTRLIVNGVSLELPDKLDITLEVDGARTIGSITFTITGGVLTVTGPDAALLVQSKNGGGIVFVGDICGAKVLNSDSNRQATVTFTHSASRDTGKGRGYGLYSV